jgi:hypothetical protein
MEYPEIKLWAKEYGDELLYSAMKRIYPQYSRLDYNFSRLVEIFGVYMVYCFIEATRPIADRNQDRMTGEKRDELAISWIENTLNPRQMYYYFIAYVKSQLSDKKVRRTRKRIFQLKNGKYLFRGDRGDFTRHLSKLLFHHVTYPLERRNKKDSKDNNSNSILEADTLVVEKLKKILRKKYPATFLQLEDSYNISKVKNKEGRNLKGPEYVFTYDDYIKNVWNSDILEIIKVWDNDLAIEE